MTIALFPFNASAGPGKAGPPGSSILANAASTIVTMSKPAAPYNLASLINLPCYQTDPGPSSTWAMDAQGTLPTATWPGIFQPNFAFAAIGQQPASDMTLFCQFLAYVAGGTDYLRMEGTATVLINSGSVDLTWAKDDSSGATFTPVADGTTTYTPFSAPPGGPYGLWFRLSGSYSL